MAPRRLLIDLAATSANWALPPDGERMLKSFAPDGWELVFSRTPTSSDGDGGARPSPELLDAIADAEAYFGFGMPRDLFVAARRLRWIHSAAAGVASALTPELRASDVVLTNSAGVHAVPIAEYVVGGVLHFLRGFDIAIEQQRSSTWDKVPFTGPDTPLRELGECRAIIVGAGGLGTAIAERLSALGATCIGFRRRIQLGTPPGFSAVRALDALDSELPRADIIVLAAAATPKTTGILDARRLALLPRHAVVVNVARGALIDEKALTKRLDAGQLRGAVLDVFVEEPLASTSPLWQLRSTLITPHVSPVSPRRFWDRALALFTDNWRRYLAGEPLRNIVDKQEGY